MKMRRLRQIFSLLLSVTLILTACGQTKKEEEVSQKGQSTTEYAQEIFGSEIIQVDILADEAHWLTMLENAVNEEYIKVNVVVNGTTFYDVGIRPKGNSSLTQVASSDSDRYSFRLKFDEYVEGQTCFELDSFVVNNMMSDNSYMKEYLSYDLMHAIGVEAPYFGFANLSLNGEAWGLYLAVEVYNDSYEERVSGDTSGALYNVKMSMGMGMQGGAEDGAQGGMQGRPQMGQERSDLSNMPQDFTENGFHGANNMGSRNGGSLIYTDDEVSSYSDIFDNAVGKSDEVSETRVVEALKALSTGEDLEEYFEVDEILRYLAAHTVVANFDSYSSSMAQNYYIYEKEGLLTILPWDYNMAWGGFQGSDASTVVNFPIDTPVLGVELSERPLIEKLLQNEDYLASYHSYLEELMTEYFADGQFEAKVRELDSLIKSYVESDPTVFCTYEEYQKAVEALIQLGTLRYESIMGQLNGEIPATTAGQEASPELLISSDTVNLSDLGNSKFGKEGMRP